MVLDHLGHPNVEYAPIEGVQEELLCGECDRHTLYVNYEVFPPRCGCRNNDCRLKPSMTVVELLEDSWDNERDGELPDDATKRKAALAAKLTEISEAKLAEEEEWRECEMEVLNHRIVELQDDASTFETERKELRGRIHHLEQDVRRARSIAAAAQSELRRNLDVRARNAAFASGSLAALFVGVWLAMFSSRAGVSGGVLMLVVPLLSVAYGAAIGYAFYLERVRARQGKRDPWYERLNLRRLGAWGGRGAVLLALPLLFVDEIAQSGAASYLASPGTTEHGWLFIAIGLTLALAWQIWASRD